MQKNNLFKQGNQIIRILEVQTEQAFMIDCVKRTMPKWVDIASLFEYTEVTEQEMQMYTNMILPEVDSLDAESKKFMYEHYTMIAGILPFVSDANHRNSLIARISDKYQVSKKSVKNYLCLFLVYQNIVALAPMSLLLPKEKTSVKELSQDEKNMRWALNKFFYSKNKNSLNTAYTMLLKQKYCDSFGVLLPEYPTFNQFRYFYRKTKNLQTYYISRNGLKNYQMNSRPLLGDGIQEYASSVGIGMLDATVCDIYLVNEAGSLIGRPILTACIDAYSSLCCGYSLLWEGGVYSLRGLMVNILTDKQDLCKQFGISIQKSDWDCDQLPATLVTDMGSEYKSENFEQIAELGVTVVNLPAYRPELKGAVEKFFDLVQDTYKPYLKGKGVIEPDYQERGSHDYRKDACLTMADFEKIILRCIIYYNSKRLIENYPYTDAMLSAQIQPFACNIWEWGKLQEGANLIAMEKEQIILTLLPRTRGKFSRSGLKVNNMRYKHENYTEKYLSGGEVMVAYNPEDVSFVWLIEKGSFIRFELIESRYRDKNLSEVEILKENQKAIIKAAASENIQAKIDLASYIEMIASSVTSEGNTSIKGVRNNRQQEQARTHVDYVEKVGVTK